MVALHIIPPDSEKPGGNVKAIKNLIIGFALGAIVGVLLGINIGKERPLLSNPFADDPMTEKAKAAAGKAKEIYEETKRIIKEQ
mgnify:CR=1 FL=1